MKQDSLIFGFLKIAGNPVKKRYWQYLKALHGGTENTVNNLKKTRDFGIYHGTTEKNMHSILSKGLESREHPLFSKLKGTFLGQKTMAKRYGDHSVRLKYPHEVPKGSNYNRADRVITEFKNPTIKNSVRMENPKQKINNQKLIHHGLFGKKRIGLEHNINSIISKDPIKPELLTKA